MADLKTIWNDLASKYTDDVGLTGELWNEIERSYSSEKRHYHNLEHLRAIMDRAFKIRSLFSDFDAVLFSVFYHDIVYDTGSRTNEEESAGIARARLTRLGVSIDKIAKCYMLILATKEHRESDDNDVNLLVDLDLVILGESPEIYKKYLKQIRAEYSNYPDAVYREGRKKVLEHFLNMERIFKTEVFYSNYEKQARSNLKAELSTLT